MKTRIEYKLSDSCPSYLAICLLSHLTIFCRYSHTQDACHLHYRDILLRTCLCILYTQAVKLPTIRNIQSTHELKKLSNCIIQTNFLFAAVLCFLVSVLSLSVYPTWLFVQCCLPFPGLSCFIHSCKSLLFGCLPFYAK